jgi:hypothetical protein
MHRPEQAGLANDGHRVGRNNHIGSDRHFDIGVPILNDHLFDTADHHVVDHDR